MNTKVGLFSFFAGAGFLDLGFESTGKYQPLFVNEFYKPFMEFYKHSRKGMNIEEPAFGSHICSIEDFLISSALLRLKQNLNEAKKTYDLVGFIGGPPCPDFSAGGKNMGSAGENGKLSGTYIELICRTKPDFFLFENVKGLYRTKKHKEFFENLKLKLINNGYCLTEKLINAIEYGAPQNRERIILIGFKREVLTDFGFVLNGSYIIKSFDWTRNTRFKADDVFALPWASTEPFEIDSIKIKPPELPAELTVEHWFNLNEVNNHPNSFHHFTPKQGLAKFQTIQEGDDLKKSYKRLHRWRYSNTAAYGNNEVHLHPYKARRISAAEALAIQSLPKDFTLPDSATLTDMFKTIGNGVPYLAAQGLALSITDFLFNNPTCNIEVSKKETLSEQLNIFH